MVDKRSVLEKYNCLKSLVIERKTQFDAFMEYLETRTEWLRSPASTRFHLSEETGLLAHSVNVAETLLKLKSTLAPAISDETCVIVALAHDSGKAGMPGMPQYILVEPTERQVRYGYKPEPPYRYNTELTYLSVPVRSLYLALRHIELTEEEAQAIIYHDGQYVDDNRSCANKETALTLLLQTADIWSCSVLEKSRQ